VNIRKRLGAIAVAAIVGLGGVAIAAPAYASNPGCGYECDGQDPSYVWWDASEVPHRCSDSARTIYTYYIDPSTWVNLRYSSWCRTAWTLTNGVGLYIQVRSFVNPSESPRLIEATTTDGNVNYTPMVNDARLYAEACEHPPASGAGYIYCGSPY
jgi:hypothetical protein